MACPRPRLAARSTPVSSPQPPPQCPCFPPARHRRGCRTDLCARASVTKEREGEESGSGRGERHREERERQEWGAREQESARERERERARGRDIELRKKRRGEVRAGNRKREDRREREKRECMRRRTCAQRAQAGSRRTRTPGPREAARGSDAPGHGAEHSRGLEGARAQGQQQDEP
jgi:hypothetical protein